MIDRRPWVIMCSARPWAAGEHRQRALAAELAGAYRVLFIDPPGNGRRRSFVVEALASDLWCAKVAAPLPGSHQWLGASRLARQRAVFDLNRWLSDQPGPRLLWIDDDLAEAMIGELSESAVIYDATDLDWTRRQSHGPLDAARHRAVTAADLVLTNSSALPRRLPPLRRPAQAVVDGCDTTPFVRPAAPPSWLSALPHPRLGYLGAVDRETLDLELVTAVARARPNWRLVLVGAADPRAARCLRRYPNVTLRRPVPDWAVPALLDGFDVGLVPYRMGGPVDHLRPPMILPYLAAGLPVVATPLPALREPNTPLRFASDAEVFVQASQLALAEADDPFAQVRRRRYAAQQSWASRGAQVRLLLAELAGATLGREIAA